MATTFKPQDSIRRNGEAGFTLQVGDTLIVDRGIVISSVLSSGVMTTGQNQINVAGAIAGFHGIRASNSSVDVLSSGLVSGERIGIFSSEGDELEVTTGGIISGGYQGIAVYGSGTIKNTGLVESGLTSETTNLNSAIYLGSSHQDTDIINRGTIRSNLANSYAVLSVAGETTSDRIFNFGTMTGNISLGGGDDLFRTAKGRVNGVIDGGAGEDTLIGSKYSDIMIGGTENDRITGGKSSDVFEFELAAGDDVITDFDAVGGGRQQDYLVLDQSMNYTEKSIHNGRDTVLNFADGHSITLLAVRASDFSNADIHFEI